jgi:hypothetical protein
MKSSCAMGPLLIVGTPTSFAEGALAVAQNVTVNPLRHIHITVSGSPVYMKAGDSTVIATRGSAGEIEIPIDWIFCFLTNPVQTDVSLIELRPSASVTVAEMG